MGHGRRVGEHDVVSDPQSVKADVFRAHGQSIERLRPNREPLDVRASDVGLEPEPVVHVGYVETELHRPSELSGSKRREHFAVELRE